MILISTLHSNISSHAWFWPELSRWSEDVWSWWSLEPGSSSLWPCLPPGLPAAASDLWTHLHGGEREVNWKLCPWCDYFFFFVWVNGYYHHYAFTCLRVCRVTESTHRWAFLSVPGWGPCPRRSCCDSLEGWGRPRGSAARNRPPLGSWTLPRGEE